MSRILYLFFIHHTKQEIPGLAQGEDEHAVKQWEWLEDQVRGLSVSRRAYFDSLDPEIYKRERTRIRCGKELADLTPCERMKRMLYQKGVKIEITESLALMIEYGKILPLVAKAHRDGKPLDFDPWEIIDKRDNFIADRIHKTLKGSETGFLFLGANHQIERFLKRDIKLCVYLGYARTGRKRKWHLDCI
jgi:hypothetical protein